MRKDIWVWVGVAAVLLLAIGFLVWRMNTEASGLENGGTNDAVDYGNDALPDGKGRDENGDVACIQVITPAKNLLTGEIKEFPTPCDVPDGWEPVQPNVAE